jgi:hypothetical protein
MHQPLDDESVDKSFLYKRLVGKKITDVMVDSEKTIIILDGGLLIEFIGTFNFTVYG